MLLIRRPLGRAICELVNAVNGLRPLSRTSIAMPLTFPTGLPTSELPVLILGASVVDALRRAKRGDFGGFQGVSALMLTVLSWLVLAVIRRRGVTTPGPVLRAALVDGFGTDFAPPPSGRRAGVLRTGTARRRYVTKADTVSYGPYGGANRADIWRHPDLPRDARAPVLVQVPGGAWMYGRRRPQSYPLLSRLAEHGWVCVSLDYRVSPRNTWPAQIVDIKRALAWVKANIADYGGDPDFVAITGGSAGGHLAALAALTPNDPAFQPGFAAADTSVVAAVPLYGRYDWFSPEGTGRRDLITMLERWVVKQSIAEHDGVFVDASPIRRVHAGAPPFFVLHGQCDTVIPVQEARAFVAALRPVSTAPVAYAELPCAQHAFDLFSSPRAHQVVDAVEAFLSRVYDTRG